MVERDILIAQLCIWERLIDAGILHLPPSLSFPFYLLTFGGPLTFFSAWSKRRRERRKTSDQPEMTFAELRRRIRGLWRRERLVGEIGVGKKKKEEPEWVQRFGKMCGGNEGEGRCERETFWVEVWKGSESGVSWAKLSWAGRGGGGHTHRGNLLLWHRQVCSSTRELYKLGPIFTTNPLMIKRGMFLWYTLSIGFAASGTKEILFRKQVKRQKKLGFTHHDPQLILQQW